MWVVIGVIFSEQYQHSFGLGRAPAGAGSSGQGVCDGDRVLSAQTSYQQNVWAELFRWTSEYPMFVLDHVGHICHDGAGTVSQGIRMQWCTAREWYDTVVQFEESGFAVVRLAARH